MEIEAVKIITESSRERMQISIMDYVSWGYDLIGNVQFSVGGDRGYSENFCATMIKYKVK